MEKSTDIKALADYAVSEGTQNSEDGQWETTYEELYNHFGVKIALGDDACRELAEALRKRREVEALTVTEDGIDVSYHAGYCKNLTTEGIAPMLEKYPSLIPFAVEMSRLADRYAKQAVACQLNGVGSIRFNDVQDNAFHENFDEALFLDMLLDRPEIEDIDSDMECYHFTVAEAYRPQEQPLRELDEDEVEVICAKHILWHNGEGGEQANFSNCLIKGVNLKYKNLLSAVFDNTRFIDVNFRNASLCFSSFEGAQFYDCELDSATAEECSFKGAKFVRTDMYYTAFGHSNLTDAQFIDCEMLNAILQGCCIENTDFGNARQGDINMENTSDNEQEWLADAGEIKMKM